MEQRQLVFDDHKKELIADEGPSKKTPAYMHIPFWGATSLTVLGALGFILNWFILQGTIFNVYVNVGVAILGAGGIMTFALTRKSLETTFLRKYISYAGIVSFVMWAMLGCNDIIRNTLYQVVYHLKGLPPIPPAKSLGMAQQTLLLVPLLFGVSLLIFLKVTSKSEMWETGFIILTKRRIERRKEEIKRNLAYAYNPSKLNEVDDVIIAYNAKTGRPAWLKPSDRTMHCLCAGPSGSGKTQGVLNPLVQQDLMHKNTGISVIEPKGDWIGRDWQDVEPGKLPGVLAMAQLYGRKVYLLDPNRQDTDVFNPFVGDVETVAEINAVALKALFGQQEAFFSIVQNTVTKNFIKLLKYVKGDDCNFLDLKDMLLDDSRLWHMLESLAKLTKITIRPAVIDPDGRMQMPATFNGIVDQTDNRATLVQWFVNEYYGAQSAEVRKHSLGLRMQLDALFSNTYFLRCVIPRKGARVINLDEHLRTNSVLCVSTNDGLLGGDLSKVLGILISQHLQAAVSRRDPTKKNPFHAIFMDEFATYVNQEFSGFIEKARGFHVGLVLGFQGLDQLMKVGEGNVGSSFRDTVIAQCGTKMFYGRLGPNDVKYIEEMFGTELQDEEMMQENRSNEQPGFVPKGASLGIRTSRVERSTMSFKDIRYQEANFVIYERMVDRSIEEPQKGYAKPVDVNMLPKRPPSTANPLDYRDRDALAKRQRDIEQGLDVDGPAIPVLRGLSGDKHDPADQSSKSIVEQTPQVISHSLDEDWDDDTTEEPVNQLANIPSTPIGFDAGENVDENEDFAILDGDEEEDYHENSNSPEDEECVQHQLVFNDDDED